MLESIKPNDRDHWLQLRTQDLTSTEISALFGLSPYMTEYELWHRKQCGDVVELEPNERMEWGLQLEAQIAAYIAEKRGWEIESFDAYHRDPECRIGASFDFLIVGGATDRDLPGLLEIKNVDGLVYRNKWIDDGEGNVEAPEHIELQVQHQMLLAGVSWAAIGVLVGGNSHRVIFREADQVVQTAIMRAAAKFWQSIDDNNPPSADYSADAKLIIDMHQHAQKGQVLQADMPLEVLIAAYAELSKEAAKVESEKKALKAEILEQIGTASKVVTSFGSLTCSEVKGSPGTMVTPDMVGKHINPRAGYRLFRVNTKKES